MIFIGKNENLISSLSENLSLLSGSLRRMDFYVDEKKELIIDLTIGLLYDPGKRIVKLRFSGIKEYSFYTNDPSLFFYIEDYKFLFLNNNKAVYLSLDPFWEDRSNEISVKDQDFILAEHVEGYFVDHLR